MVEATNTSGTPYVGKVWLVSNMGSDSDTTYEATSTSITNSANANPGGYTSADSWAITSDKGQGDPVAVHIFGEDISNVPSTVNGYGSVNRNGSTYLITEYALAIQPAETTKRAWFDGLVGYHIGNFGNAVARAQSAADELARQDFDWNGDLSNIELPTLKYQASQMSCPVSRNDADLSVLVFSKFTLQPQAGSVYTDGTVYGSGSAVSEDMCGSTYLDTHFFDGGDGTEETWMQNLQGVDVLVLTRTSGPLAGSDQMNSDVLPALRNWVRNGGRIVFTAGSSFIPELASVAGVDKEYFEVRSIPSGQSFYRQNALSSLPYRLQQGSSALSGVTLKLTYELQSQLNQANQTDLNQPDVLSSLYSSWTATDEAVSAATTFSIGRGQVNFLSADFSGEYSFDGGNISLWRKLLLQSTYGSASQYNWITEARGWYPTVNGTYWTESEPAAQVTLGMGGGSTSVPCLNTVSRPTILKIRTWGTEMLCGAVDIYDGVVDGGVSAQLTRTFYSQGPWLKTSLALTNNDDDVTYSRQIMFGGSQAQQWGPYADGPTMEIEATSSNPNGTTNLGYGDSWIVASAGN
ncbi:MAG: hypothetical protein EBU96_10675, partial [Actinobacteria bacterium]|nr:hypothetical protein [Actinomycetota bacterium]